MKTMGLSRKSTSRNKLKDSIENKQKHMHYQHTDLNPVYANFRHDRAVKTSKRYLNAVGSNLKEAHFEIVRENFKNEVMKGKRLNLNELKDMNQHLKTDYIRLIKKIDSEVNKDIKFVEKEARREIKVTDFNLNRSYKAIGVWQEEIEHLDEVVK